MVEENKGKVIVLNKKIVIAIALIIVIAIVIWFLFFRLGGKVLSEDSPVLGNPNATLYVVEFSDYKCQFCQAVEGTNQKVIDELKRRSFEWEAPIPKIISEYVNTGKVKLVFRHYPVHQDNNPALASKCAQEQGKFWEYHKILFENYNALTMTDLKKYAADLSLNLNQFNDCLESKKYDSSIQNDINDGQGLGIGGTPMFFIGNEEKGYKRIEGAAPFSAFKTIIDSNL